MSEGEDFEKKEFKTGVEGSLGGKKPSDDDGRTSTQAGGVERDAQVG